MAGRRNTERRRPPALAVAQAQALADLSRQLEEGSALLAVTTVHTPADLEGFRLRVGRWRDGTTERLRRLFDQEEYANRFYTAASAARITSVPRVGPVWGVGRDDFNQLHTALRRAFSMLEGFRDLVQEGVVGPAAVAELAPPAQARFRDVHIHVAGSGAVGQVNVGASVQNIQSHINALGGPDADTIARAFKELTESATQDTALDNAARAEVIEHYEDLAEQADTPPERRRWSRINGALARIPAVLRTAIEARQAWDQWGPTIEGVFRHM